MTELDIENWARKEHFHFFRQFEEPFFGITVRLDCTEAYQTAKKTNTSFFLYYLHQILRAVNEVACFRYRIRQDRVVIHDRIHASATINREDGTFDFSLLPFSPDFKRFSKDAQSEIDRIRGTSGLNLGVAGDDVIHFSAVPWLDFTSLSHARRFSYPDSCPKLSVGKLTERDGRLGMPLSIHAHHALMDGRDVATFIKYLKDSLAGAD